MCRVKVTYSDRKMYTAGKDVAAVTSWVTARVSRSAYHAARITVRSSPTPNVHRGERRYHVKSAQTSLNSSGIYVYVLHIQTKTREDNRLRVPPVCHFCDQRTGFINNKFTACMLQKYEYILVYCRSIVHNRNIRKLK